MTAIRGAITANENTTESIGEASISLMRAIADNNDISTAVTIVISTTNDITAKYPATAIRESGISSAPLFSCAEPDIDGALKMCIRVLILLNADITAKHIYLGEAKALRRDLEEK